MSKTWQPGGLYRLVRMFRDHPERNYTVRGCNGLYLEEAKAHCSDPHTSSSTCTTTAGIKLAGKYGPWFDGFEAIKVYR
jgi:hypothetical protein